MVAFPPPTYGAPARAFHWLTLALVLVQFTLAWRWEAAEPATRVTMVALHKSLGITILLLTLARLAWRRWAGAPALPPGIGRLQRLAARGTHGLIYLWMLGMPVVGWLGSNAVGRVVLLFGMPLPTLLSPDRPLGRTLFWLHGWGADLLIALVGLHAAAALYHHYWLKDGVLRRMLTGRAPAAAD